MVGVFLGFQVDNWNEDRKERIEEGQYLESLKADFEASIILAVENFGGG